MGLPRSSLLKSKSTDGTAVATPDSLPAPPFAVAPAAPVPVSAPPAWLSEPVAPVTAFAPAANPFTTAAPGPSVFAAPPPVEQPVRDAFRTKADSIEVQVESQRAPAFANDVMRAPYASAPSATELVERAVALGPARMTWASIVLPDPVLQEKRLPHVAERRARLTRVVKLALGACVGLCVLALGVSALTGGSSPPSAMAATSAGKTVASKGVVPVETLTTTSFKKAPRHTVPAATATRARRVKRR